MTLWGPLHLDSWVSDSTILWWHSHWSCWTSSSFPFLDSKKHHIMTVHHYAPYRAMCSWPSTRTREASGRFHHAAVEQYKVQASSPSCFLPTTSSTSEAVHSVVPKPALESSCQLVSFNKTLSQCYHWWARHEGRPCIWTHSLKYCFFQMVFMHVLVSNNALLSIAFTYCCICSCKLYSPRDASTPQVKVVPPWSYMLAEFWKKNTLPLNPANLLAILCLSSVFCPIFFVWLVFFVGFVCVSFTNFVVF